MCFCIKRHPVDTRRILLPLYYTVLSFPWVITIPTFNVGTIIIIKHRWVCTKTVVDVRVYVLTIQIRTRSTKEKKKISKHKHAILDFYFTRVLLNCLYCNVYTNLRVMTTMNLWNITIYYYMLVNIYIYIYQICMYMCMYACVWGCVCAWITGSHDPFV